MGHVDRGRSYSGGSRPWCSECREAHQNSRRPFRRRRGLHRVLNQRTGGRPRARTGDHRHPSPRRQDKGEGESSGMCLRSGWWRGSLTAALTSRPTRWCWFMTRCRPGRGELSDESSDHLCRRPRARRGGGRDHDPRHRTAARRQAAPGPGLAVPAGAGLPAAGGGAEGGDQGAVHPPVRGLPGHPAHVLGVRPGPVRPEGPDRPDGVQRRAGVQEREGGPAGPARDGQPDLPARDPGHARGVHQPRPPSPTSPSRRPRTGATGIPTGRPSTTRSTTSTPASSPRSCCPPWPRISTSRRTRRCGASAGRAPERSPRSRWRGRSRTTSARCSRTSAAS